MTDVNLRCYTHCWKCRANLGKALRAWQSRTGDDLTSANALLIRSRLVSFRVAMTQCCDQQRALASFFHRSSKRAFK